MFCNQSKSSAEYTFTYCNIRHDGWCNKVSFLKTLYFHVTAIQLNLEKGNRIFSFRNLYSKCCQALYLLSSKCSKVMVWLGYLKLALTKFYPWKCFTRAFNRLNRWSKQGWNWKSGQFYQCHAIKYKLLIHHCVIPRRNMKPLTCGFSRLPTFPIDRLARTYRPLSEFHSENSAHSGYLSSLFSTRLHQITDTFFWCRRNNRSKVSTWLMTYRNEMKTAFYLHWGLELHSH